MLRTLGTLIVVLIITHLGGMLNVVEGDKNNTSAGVYFPTTTIGSYWIYEDQDGQEITRRAVKAKKINGKTYSAFSYEPELKDQTAYSPYIYPALYNINNAGNITLLCGDEVEAVIKTRLAKEIAVFNGLPNIAKISTEIEVQANILSRFLPSTPVWDTPWEVNKIEINTKIDGNQEIVIDFTITETGRVLGIETIKTPAGLFEDCLRVEYKTQTEVEVSMTPKPSPDEVGLAGETITTLWFVPNIGIVKYHQEANPIFLSMIPADAFELDITKLLPNTERTFQLKEVNIK